MGEMFSNNEVEHEMCNFKPYNSHTLETMENNTAAENVQKQRQKPKWKDEWQDFVQNTTLHGLRFISMEDTFLVRRLFWFLLVLVCFFGMSVQILDRIIYFHSSPVNVNVKVNYNQSLIFPAITLCNQNAFKSTLATKYHWYRLIESMYNGSSDAFVADKLKQLNASAIKIDELFRKAAHRKEDMIVECTWADVKCGPENFTAVLTDHGLCYTFNTIQPNGSEPKTAKATGADHGLKLLLNVEQYEYMPGPNDAAGIKLLPHDHGEFPRVRELGISIPTGSHAFVGLRVLQIENLRYPYGQCSENKLKYFDSYSYDSCQIECLTNEIAAGCGCRDFYMPHSSELPPVCTLQQYYDCFLYQFENVRQNTIKKKCDCPTPCKYYLYDPVLSYGGTTSHAAEKLLDSTDSGQLKEDLKTARETNHRMETKKFKQFTDSILEFENALTEVKELFVSKIFEKVSLQLGHIAEKYKEINRLWNKKSFLYRYQMYVIQKNFIRGRDAMEERTLAHLCNAFHEFVYYVKTNIEHLVNENQTDTNKVMYHTLLTDQINLKMENAKRALDNYTVLYEAYQDGTPIFRYKYNRIPRYNNNYIVPKPLMKRALVRNFYAKKFSPRMGEDIKRIIQSLEGFKEVIDDIHNNNDISNSTYRQNLYDGFIDGCEDYYHSKSVFYYEVVDWPVKILTSRMENFQNTKNEFITVRDFIQSNLENLQDSLTIMNNKSVNLVQENVSMLNWYRLFGNITKTEIANNLLSMEIDEAIEQCKQTFQEIRVRAQNVYDGWTQLIDKSINVWKPVLNDNDMLEYYNFINNSLLLRNFSVVTAEINSDYTKIRNEHDLRFVIGSKDSIFLKSFNKLQVKLRSFLRSIEVDETVLRNNFLQLDIFYRELNYEEINQQRAYDIFALLCDIGGSIGLFVGASVMTLFELIDLFTNFSARRFLR